VGSSCSRRGTLSTRLGTLVEALGTVIGAVGTLVEAPGSLDTLEMGGAASIEKRLYPRLHPAA
jgi:hypothetical protein